MTRHDIGQIAMTLFLFVYLSLVVVFVYDNHKCRVVSPLQDEIVSPIPEHTSTPTLTPTPARTELRGLASYYSLDGCIGCREDRIMANGEKLDDNRITVAFNRASLGTMLQIRNNDNGNVILAEITDTGGFEAHGKIIDLSVAARDALGCGSTCSVTITL